MGHHNRLIYLFNKFQQIEIQWIIYFRYGGNIYINM